MRDLSETCVKVALVDMPSLRADRVAWFGVRQTGICEHRPDPS
jgi:hypothetical protein